MPDRSLFSDRSWRRLRKGIETKTRRLRCTYYASHRTISHLGASGKRPTSPSRFSRRSLHNLTFANRANFSNRGIVENATNCTMLINGERHVRKSLHKCMSALGESCHSVYIHFPLRNGWFIILSLFGIAHLELERFDEISTCILNFHRKK